MSSKLKEVLNELKKRGVVTTQEEMGDKMKYTKGYFSNLINNKEPVNQTLKNKCYKVFGVSLKYWETPDGSPVIFSESGNENMPYDIGQRLQYFRENFTDKSHSDFAKTLAINKAQYISIEKGNTSLTIEQLKLLHDAFDINISWLVTNIGDPQTVSENPADVLRNITKNFFTAEVAKHIVPIVSNTETLLPNFIDNLPPKDEEQKDDGFIYMPELVDAEFAVRVFSPNMSPTYKPGDLIAVKKVEITNVFFGYRYLIYFKDGQKHIAQIAKCETKKHWLLVNENDEYDDNEVPVDNVKAVYLIKARAGVEVAG